jgi:hypothetical protein
LYHPQYRVGIISYFWGKNKENPVERARKIGSRITPDSVNKEAAIEGRLFRDIRCATRNCGALRGYKKTAVAVGGAMRKPPVSMPEAYGKNSIRTDDSNSTRQISL